MPHLGILVGVDDSPGSLRAVDWAAREAVLRGTTLTVCHVLRYEPAHVPVPFDVLRDLTGRGQALVERAAARAEATLPRLGQRPAVQRRFERGHVAEILVQLAGDAEEVVLGCRGAGGFAGLAIGSVPAQVAGYAPGPVTVVGHDPDSMGPVVAGVACRGNDRAVLEHAFRFASRRDLPVSVLHAVAESAPAPIGAGSTDPTLVRRRRAALRTLTELLETWTAKFPEVAARPTVVIGHPGSRLGEASLGSTLLVVGSRGHDGVSEPRLGSVGYCALRNAHCPVTIVG